MVLFNTIVENSIGTDEELTAVKQFEHLAVTKKHLYEQILEAMHRYSASSDIEEQIRSLAPKAHFLIDRRLMDQAIRLIRKGKRQAEKLEKHGLLVELLAAEKRWISSQGYTPVTLDQLEDLGASYAESLELLGVENQYWLLFSKIYKSYYGRRRTEGPSNDRLDELFEDPILTSIGATRTVHCRLDFYQLNALKHFLKGRSTQAAEYNSKFISEFERNDQLIQVYPDRYLATFNNYLIDRFTLKEYEALEAGLTQLRAMPESAPFRGKPQIELQVFRLGTQLELNMNAAKGDYSKTLELMPDLLNAMDNFGSDLPEQNRVTFFYLLAHAAFMAGEYSHCIDCVAKITEETDESVMQEMQGTARLLDLLSHYELENEELLVYRILNLRRYHARRSRLFQLEKAMLSSLNKAINAPKKERRSVFSNLLSRLEEIRNNPKERIPFEQFDFIGWAEKKAGREPKADS